MWIHFFYPTRVIFFLLIRLLRIEIKTLLKYLLGVSRLTWNKNKWWTFSDRVQGRKKRNKLVFPLELEKHLCKNVKYIGIVVWIYTSTHITHFDQTFGRFLHIVITVWQYIQKQIFFNCRKDTLQISVKEKWWEIKYTNKNKQLNVITRLSRVMTQSHYDNDCNTKNIWKKNFPLKKLPLINFSSYYYIFIIWWKSLLFYLFL